MDGDKAKVNVGKKFEKNFSACVPKYVGLIRIPDPAQSFSNASNLRFTRKNPYDFLMWNPRTYTLYALELKTVKAKSISFERTKEENGEIHLYQIEGLKKLSDVGNCVCGFIIEFREIEKTIFLNIDDFLKLSDAIDKKSFTISDLESNNIPFVVIEQHLMKTNSKYGVEDFLTATAIKIESGENNEV